MNGDETVETYEPAVETEEKAPEPATEKLPATAAVKAPAKTQTQAVGSAKQFTEDMEAEGLEGLEIDGFSFPTITLPGEGYFQLSGDEDSNLGKKIEVMVLGSRSRYICKQDDSKDADSFFSYDADCKTKTDGSDATVILDQWAADSGEPNYRPVIKKYLDVMAEVVGGESEGIQEMAGDTVILSIPPTSVSRLSGVLFRMKARGGSVSSTPLICGVAKKRKTEGGGFYPWEFSLGK